MKNLTELLMILGFCGIAFLSYFIYGVLRKKQISVAVAIKHCNLFWAGAMALFFIGCCVNAAFNQELTAAPETLIALMFAVLLCLFYLVVYAIGQFAAMLLRKIGVNA